MQYTNQILFTFLLLGIGQTGIKAQTVTDIEGNTYKTVKIGTQTWMAENLKTTKYDDGSNIPLVTDNSAWGELRTPGYCWFNNDKATYGSLYGALYNWYTTQTGKICPKGWHVPSHQEWKELVKYLGGDSIAGGQLKEAGTTHWKAPNTQATNKTGFSALPGGNRTIVDGMFFNNQKKGSWWTSTADLSYDAWHWYLSYKRNSVDNYTGIKELGLSIRCVKD